MREPGKPSKQYRLLGGLPLLIQTLRAFERHPGTDEIIVVVGASEVEGVAEALRIHGIEKLAAVVAGGDTRQQSVGRGLAAVSEMSSTTLVHDAVRPFVSAALITSLIDAARAHGAAAPALPVTDTLRRGVRGMFGDTVDREDLWRMQTPQVARTEWMKQAHKELEATDRTDEVALLREMGLPVRIVEGSSLNIKVTTPSDWDLAERLWPTWEKRELLAHR